MKDNKVNIRGQLLLYPTVDMGVEKDGYVDFDLSKYNIQKRAQRNRNVD